MSCPIFETYEPDRGEHVTPCQCPQCKGFLKWEEKDGEMQPTCNKCKVPLIAIYDAPEDELDAEIRKKYNFQTGKICVLKSLDDNNEISGERGPGVGDGSDPKNCSSLPIERRQPSPKTSYGNNN